MDSVHSFLTRSLRNGLLWGVLLAIAALLLFGEGQAFSLLAGALFMCLNLLLLGWLLAAATSQKGAGKGLLVLLECAKLPGAYLLLYWLVTRDYAEPIGLVAGLTVVLLAAVVSGLTGNASQGQQA